MEPWLNVLIVEDSTDDEALILRELRRGGESVRHERVETPDEMLAAMRRDRWDVILSDFSMPHFSGKAALDLVRKSGFDIPFILVSGTIGEDIAVEALKAGASDYIMKGQLARLVPAIKRELREAESRRARHRAEEALRESEERFRLVAQATNDWIWDWDMYTNLVWRSEGFLDVGGEQPVDVGSIYEFWRDRIHPEDSGRIISSFRSVVQERGLYWTGEYRLRRADGSYANIFDRGYIIYDANGEPNRTIGAMMDVTERKNLEAQLVQAQKIEAVGQLAGGVAHDFNNILTIILGYAETLSTQLGTGSPLHEEVNEIRDAGERAATLTRQLLAFSRKQILEPRILDLNDLVKNVEKMLRRLIGENIDLVTLLEPRLHAVRADPGQLEQVIVNLVVNSRDAMPQGGSVTIETADVDLDDNYAATHPSVRSGKYVMIAVSDTGTGMDESTKSRIFEPFFTTKEKGKGTGLGLSTVYGIVKQSEGFVWVYTEPGHGTTFKIYLPRAEVPATPIKSRRPQSAAAGGSETILLVEDASPLRKLARRILEGFGYAVIEASGGVEALEAARQHEGSISLVLTDVVMPGMQGPELVSQLRALKPAIRALYMSGYTDDDVVRRGFLDERDAFLQKPFTPSTLGEKVREVLGSDS